ncbi:hypothetical protein [Amniculibacterium sp. G2-70]|uniref:hypothetical protein n=1 Tax=Amniculibacterium sp. G2-70 TaxID=2767188 RepID=UPI001654A57B|nr:hypothetical protein [Amniculibacterium sp. G2-70]
MANEVDGLWLQQYVEPQLLEDFQNYRDDFIGAIKRANPGAIDKDGIRFNKLINNVGFKVNANVDFTPAKMDGKKTLVEWDKLDTTPTNYSDADLRAMAFDKESEIRKAHTDAFKLGVRDYALNKLAPKSHVAGKMPVIRTTGAEFEGRKRMTYVDLLNFYNMLSPLNLLDGTAWNFVLSAEHRADLMVDKASTSNYRDIEFDKTTGEVSRFFKLKLFENNDTPLYDASGNLKSLGSNKIATDQKASVFFYTPNTVYHIEQVMILFNDMRTDVISKDPESKVRLHTYGLCDKKQEHGFGAVISDNV